MKKIKPFIFPILIPLFVGGIVGILISQSIDYTSLQKPPLAPPGIVFPIVWTILYFLMGLSYGILKKKSLTDPSITLIYYLQLAVNALWSIFFFLFKWRFFSFLWILLLIVLVIWMILKFYSKDKMAALIQIPYLIWILFAAYLNISIYFLNRYICF